MAIYVARTFPLAFLAKLTPPRCAQEKKPKLQELMAEFIELRKKGIPIPEGFGPMPPEIKRLNDLLESGVWP